MSWIPGWGTHCNTQPKLQLHGPDARGPSRPPPPPGTRVTQEERRLSPSPRPAPQLSPSACRGAQRPPPGPACGSCGGQTRPQRASCWGWPRRGGPSPAPSRWSHSWQTPRAGGGAGGPTRGCGKEGQEGCRAPAGSMLAAREGGGTAARGTGGSKGWLGHKEEPTTQQAAPAHDHSGPTTTPASLPTKPWGPEATSQAPLPPLPSPPHLSRSWMASSASLFSK